MPRLITGLFAARRPAPARTPDPLTEAPDVDLYADVASLRCQLAAAVAGWEAAGAEAALARAEAQALRARLVPNRCEEQLARAHATLLVYENQLATCRELHGGNSRSTGRPTHLGALA